MLTTLVVGSIVDGWRCEEPGQMVGKKKAMGALHARDDHLGWRKMPSWWL
jgi:hypothetical protein